MKSIYLAGVLLAPRYLRQHCSHLIVALAVCAGLLTGAVSPEAAAFSSFAFAGATADYWSDADLKALAYNGLVNESVMQKIWNLSMIPLPFTDLVGYGEPINGTPHGWTQDDDGSVDVTNAAVDGADASGNDAAGGARVQNHCQICEKPVSTTERAQAVGTIGRANEHAYQIAKSQRRNRKDIEAICLYPQASVADDGNSTAGQVGTFPSWLTTNTDIAGGGANGGFQTGTGLVTAPTPGTTPRALDASLLGDLIESIYNENGNVTALMSRPAVIRRLNQFILANPSSFAVATPTANVGTDMPTGQVAQGYINVIITDFNTTLSILPNRLQQLYNTNHTDLFLIDTGAVELCNLIGEHTAPLAKLGTADRAQISQQWTLVVGDEAAHGVFRDINESLAMVA